MSLVIDAHKTTDYVVTASDWNQFLDNFTALTPAGLTFIIDGASSAIAAEMKGEFEIPFDCDLDSVRVANDSEITGTSVVSIAIDLQHTSGRSSGMANSTGSIVDSTGIAISSGDFVAVTDVSGYLVTSFSEGDWIAVKVNSCSTCKRAAVAFRLTRD